MIILVLVADFRHFFLSVVCAVTWSSVCVDGVFGGQESLFNLVCDWIGLIDLLSGLWSAVPMLPMWAALL